MASDAENRLHVTLTGESMLVSAYSAVSSSLLSGFDMVGVCFRKADARGVDPDPAAVL